MIRKPNYDYLAPVWTGDIAYNESFLPIDGVRNALTGKLWPDGVIPLLYPATEILEVRDAALENTFEEGRDYELCCGCLKLTTGSRIRRMTLAEYNPAEKSPNAFTNVGFTCSDGGYLFFAEGPEMHSRQYVVTYRHTGLWDAVIPAHIPGKLPKLGEKLANKTPVRIGFTGDSITTGANSSGAPFIDIPPYLAMWPELICGAISEKYGPCECLNRSKGGVCSNWGVDTALESFSPADCVRTSA